MRIDMSVNRIMPKEIKQNVFDCVMENTLELKDENGSELVFIKIAYYVRVDSQGEEYSQGVGEALYFSLHGMFIKKINGFLNEAEYPPIPMNIGVKRASASDILRRNKE